MMLKVLGSLLIIISTSLLGWIMAYGYKLRLNVLDNLIMAMSVFKGELYYAAPQLSDICYKVADKTEGEVSRLFQFAAGDFYEKHGDNAECIWLNAVENTEMVNMSLNDIKALADFGKCLGHPSRDMQYESVDIFLSYIDKEKQDLQVKEQRNSRLFKTMSLLFGILVVVVLI